ncbi:MAG: hypothetical protein WKF92_04975 [Pyrinomonadaceae bacterium]
MDAEFLIATLPNRVIPSLAADCIKIFAIAIEPAYLYTVLLLENVVYQTNPKALILNTLAEDGANQHAERKQWKMRHLNA